MSRLLDSYDPCWKERHRVIRAMLDEHIKSQREHWTPDGQERGGWLLSQLHRAYDAQFRTVAEYEVPRKKEAEHSAKAWGIELAWPELGEEATREDVDATFRAYRDLLERLRVFKGLPARAEWPDPIFRAEPPAGVERIIQDRVFKWNDVETAARIVFEHHAEHIHVCLIQPPGPCHGISHCIADIATILQTELMPAPKRSIWRRRPRAPATTFYFYAPEIFWGVRDQVARVEFLWDGERYTRPQWRPTSAVPPALFEASLDWDPALKWLSGWLS